MALRVSRYAKNAYCQKEWVIQSKERIIGAAIGPKERSN